MNRNLKVFLLLVVVFASTGWAVWAARRQMPGGQANNGYTGEPAFRGRPERPRMPEGTDREAMRAAFRSGDQERIREMQQRMRDSITPEMRQEMEGRRAEVRRRFEERRAKHEAMLSQSDLRDMEQMRRQRGRGFGPGRGGRGGGGWRGGGPRGGDRPGR